MNNQKVFTITLSQEEILIALGYLNATGMAGFDPTIFKNMTRKNLDLVTGIVERGLLARGLLVVEKDELALHPAIAGIIDACSSPRYSTWVQQSRAGIPELSIYFHQSGEIKVIHALPAASIHQFVVVNVKDSFGKALLSLLKLHSIGGGSGLEGEIGTDTITNAHKAITKGRNKDAIKLISDSPLARNVADEFVKALTNLTASTTIVSLDHQQPEGENRRGFMVLETGNGYWTITPAPTKNSRVDKSILRSEKPDEIINKIRELKTLF